MSTLKKVGIGAAALLASALFGIIALVGYAKLTAQSALMFPDTEGPAIVASTHTPTRLIHRHQPEHAEQFLSEPLLSRLLKYRSSSTTRPR